MFLSCNWLLYFLVYALAKDAHGQQKWSQETANSNSLTHFSSLEKEVDHFTSGLDHRLLPGDDYSCSAASKLTSKI